MFHPRSLLVLVALLPLLQADAPADKVTSLPGLNFTLTWDHYSGYLQASPTRLFHYWFTKSQHDATKDPVILWLNGGPGCSSLGGLIEELGPFHVADFGNTVYENKWAWNKVGSVIFLESPAGVGFSYATDGNVATNDDEVAQNNYNALVDFFKNKFPEFKTNDFYITGESYGGVYIPTLGVLVAADKTNFPNFKGVAIGNGIVSFPQNYNTMAPLFYYHSLVREEYWKKLSTQCCQGNAAKCDIWNLFNEGTCRRIAIDVLDAADELDPYNLYSACYFDGGSSTKRNFIRRHMRKRAGLPSRPAGRAVPLCAQYNGTEAYLNRADVRRALNIPTSLPRWEDCSDLVGDLYDTIYDDLSPQVLNISASGAKILFYNGDVDTVCNHAMNRLFIDNLNLTIQGSEVVNKAWYYNGEDPNVGGFQILYSGLGGKRVDFISVRGSGHFVPEDRPREALQFLYNWINDRDYSNPVPAAL